MGSNYLLLLGVYLGNKNDILWFELPTSQTIMNSKSENLAVALLTLTDTLMQIMMLINKQQKKIHLKFNCLRHLYKYKSILTKTY